MTKKEMRQVLNEGLAVYFASGKAITKCPTVTRNKRVPKIEIEEDVVEIEVDLLPEALRKRFFEE